MKPIRFLLVVIFALFLAVALSSAAPFPTAHATTYVPDGLTATDWAAIQDFLPSDYLKASNTEAGDHFFFVAVDGDTVVVGAAREDSNATGVNGDQANNSTVHAGAVYVFTRTGGVWSQQAYLKASNTEASDYFGWAVAVDGDTMVVGAYGENSNATGVNGDQANNSASDAGAAYVFTRTGGVWSQQAYLKASNTGAGDEFGWAVAIDGEIVVIGARGENSNATGVNGDGTNNLASNSGAAYVFVRSGGAWSQQAYLKASNTGAQDGFGVAVAVDGETVVVGAALEDGSSTGVNGDETDNSASNAGAAYVFIRTGGVWSQQAYLKASNTGVDDWFGRAVAVDGDTVVVGAWGEDSNATGVNGDQANNSASAGGAAYVFTRTGELWTQQAYLKASNTGWGDNFGYSLAIDGDIIVVGALGENSNATGVNGDQTNTSAVDAGAAYVFTRTGGVWSQQAYLKASNTEANEQFGYVVAVDGDTVVMGAPYEDSNATGVNGNQVDNSAADAGAAYIFRIAPVPIPITDLTANTGTNSGQIDLTWTATGSEGNNEAATRYFVRYAQSPITTELGWLNATDVSGEPVPQPAGSSESMTVSGLVPGENYYFAIRAENELGNLSGLSNSPNAIAQEDLSFGFLPNPDGYQFINPGFMQPTCADFQRSYSGIPIQCTNGQPQEAYRTLFASYKNTFSTGICTGMATSSLLYYTGVDPRPQPTTTFALNFSQARDNIAMYHGRQHSQAVLDVVLPEWNSWQGDAATLSQRVDAVYQQIETALTSGNNNPLVLNLFPRPNCGATGHTILPYRIDASDPLRPKVYIYENFAPNDANKFIQFDFSTPVHQFNYWLWDSASCGSLVAVPISAFTVPAAKIPSPKIHISTGGAIAPLLENELGEQIGYNDGELVTAIPNAMPIFNWYTPNVTVTQVTDFLVAPDTYTTTLQNTGGAYTFSVWSASGALDLYGGEQSLFSGKNGSTNTGTDYLSFDASLNSAILSTDSNIERPIQLRLSIPDVADNQVYELNNIDMVMGGNLSVMASDAELRIQSEGLATGYDVSFSTVSTQIQSTFAHSGLHILNGDIHILTFLENGTALLQIDNGGDGSIEETIILENQGTSVSHIYLPMVIRQQ